MTLGQSCASYYLGPLLRPAFHGMGGAPLLLVGHILWATNKYRLESAEIAPSKLKYPLPIPITASQTFAVASHTARDEARLTTHVVGSSVAVT